jgi:1-acyl-sn-glycerol-3-phosphate acyltransferase
MGAALMMSGSRRPPRPGDGVAQGQFRGPPIAFAPALWWERLLFKSLGWPLFVASMRRLAEAPAELTAFERASLQRGIGARLLRHLRVSVEYQCLAPLPTQPHVIVSLHEGLADALCLSQLSLPMRYVAREEIFEWPWIGPALRRMRHISIEPEQGAAGYRKLLAAAKATMQEGEHVVLFPQGVVLGIEAAFLPGAFRLARMLRAPILPVVLTGSHRIWEHPFSARVRYGQSVGVAVLPSLSADEVHRQSPEQMRVDLQRRMKAIALSGNLPEPRHFVPQRDGFWDGFAFEIDDDFPGVLRQVNSHRNALPRRQA